jgi:pseudouridine kinase
VTEHPKKQQLLELIRANPFISQQELASALGLSRPAVANHIAGLIRERKLLGRAYVLPDHRPVTCIGAANLDRKLRSTAGIAMHTSNPAHQSESFGGVARNIAENLARLGTPVALLTATGKDSSGAALLAHAHSVGIDTAGTLQLADAASGTYTAVLDRDGEMVVALADMALYDRLDAAFIDSCQARLAASALVVADLNLPLETVDALIAQARRAEAPLVLVAVSEPKMARLPRDLTGVRLLILNRGELAARVGRALATETELDAAVLEVRAQGARDLIVTRGAEGVLTTRGSADEDKIVRLHAHGADVVDVTGAGDAFAAAVCWSLLQDADDLELACRRGLKLSALTLGVADTVHPRLGPDSLADIPTTNTNTNTNTITQE